MSRPEPILIKQNYKGLLLLKHPCQSIAFRQYLPFYCDLNYSRGKFLLLAAFPGLIDTLLHSC